jgi:putative glutamine amidotransferase
VSRPLIGVPTQTLQAIEIIPEGLPHSWVMNSRYFMALTLVEAAPIMVPLFAHDEATLRTIYERLDGVFLAGGVDVDPSTYREDKLDVCGTTDPDRDRVEIMFAKWAIDEGKPVLGVCRGMQVINVACGGSLVQDVENESPRFLKHDYYPTQGFARDYLAHEAMVTPDSYLHTVYGGATIMVNSMHHQAIRKLGAHLAATVHAPDNLIEGIEGTLDNFLVGVQWHPEMLIERDAGTRKLFTEFRDAAEAYSLTSRRA